MLRVSQQHIQADLRDTESSDPDNLNKASVPVK